jgi:hypothetical protein
VGGGKKLKIVKGILDIKGNPFGTPYPSFPKQYMVRSVLTTG